VEKVTGVSIMGRQGLISSPYPYWLRSLGVSVRFIECRYNEKANAQKPTIIFQGNGRVHVTQYGDRLVN
jgi:hypothetical protein